MEDLNFVLNKMRLLKKTLEFYANKDNYVQNKNVGYNISSTIEMDEGNMARTTLDEIKKMDSELGKMEDIYTKLKEETDLEKKQNLIDQLNRLNLI